MIIRLVSNPFPAGRGTFQTREMILFIPLVIELLCEPKAVLDNCDSDLSRVQYHCEIGSEKLLLLSQNTND